MAAVINRVTQALIFIFMTLVTLKNGWSLPLAAHFEPISIKQGLSNTTVHAITQDAQGYLWIGTDSGLNRYDGYQNQIFQYNEQNPQSLSGGRVWSLLFHHQNNQLWIGLINGDLNVLDTNTSTITRYSFKQSDRKALSILAIGQINQHLLALGSTVGLRIFDITTGKSIVIDTITTPTETFTLKHTQLALSSHQSANQATQLKTGQQQNSFFWLVADQRLFKIPTSALTQLDNQTSLSGELMLTLPGRIRSVTADKKGQSLWLATNKEGLFHYNLLSSQLLPTPLSPAQQNQLKKTQITSVRTDSDNIWLGTDDDGLFRIRQSDGQLNQFKHNPYDPNSSGDNRINTLHIDHSGVLWTGTHSDGLNKLTIASLNFGHFNFHQQYPDCMGNNKIYAVLQDSDNNTWLGSYAGGLSKISSDGQQCSKYIHDPKNSHSISNNRVMSLAQTRDGKILVGTMDGLNIFHPDSGHFSRYSSTSDLGHFSAHNIVYSILQDQQDAIWMGTYSNGLYQFDAQLKPLAHFKANKSANGLKNNRVNSIIQDHLGTIWIGTLSGVNTLGSGLGKPALASFELLNQQQQPKKQGHYVTAIHQDSHNTVWIATTYGVHRIADGQQTLLSKKSSKNSSKKSSKENGLSDNVVYGLLSDQEYLWMSTAKGINRVNLSTLAVEHYTTEHGIQDMDFTVAAFNKGPQNPLFFGGVNGFNAFYPKDIAKNNVAPLTVISDLTIHDQSYDHVYNKDYGKVSDTLNLPYQQNDLSFGLTALHYVAPQKNQYAHQLIGFDNQWVNTGANERRFRYRHLPPGQYTLMAKSSNNEGVWSEQQQLLSFSIATPWWSSWWTWIIYSACLMFSIHLIVQFYTYRIQQQNIRLEDKVQQRTEKITLQAGEISQQKTVIEALLAKKELFFVNVSHEFRTPLTLILGPIQKMLASESDQQRQATFNLVIRNAHRLSRMVDQLLDLSKYNHLSQAQAKIYPLDEVISFISQSFVSVLDTKGISLDVVGARPVRILALPDSLEKIFANLLSNAAKYSGDNSKITISFTFHHQQNPGDHRVSVAVADGGFGISESDLATIFNRYTRFTDDHDEAIQGTGIGLALVKDLVEQNKGTLSVQSQLNVGTTFTVTLPMSSEPGGFDADNGRDSEYSLGEIDPEPIEQELLSISKNNADDSLQPSAVAATLASVNNQINSAVTNVLIVEDNDELRTYLASLFNDEYNVLLAENGEQGIEEALKHIPDLIISDVMMPKKDGFELCAEVKNHPSTSHIPIILLTASADADNRMKGWEKLTDDYIAKPFSAEELLLRTKNLLKIRRLLAQNINQQLHEPTNNLDNVTEMIDSKDNEFLAKFKSLIEEHYQDSELKLNGFCRLIGMSESQLQRKLKAVADYNFQEYLRNYRLSKAKALLEAGRSVSEAAFNCGFSSGSYFTKCFRAQYDITPTKFSKQAKKS
ncbi:MAG: signal transduction histidine kinase/ligand-binding sensor domain-containing protein [Phenylobacterium sp.]|jgi:signal transduction histidine kinase/ligand-binding sensor domain-containing protein/CheY-like chemotaxis protein